MPVTRTNKKIKSGWQSNEPGWGADLNADLEYLSNYAIDQWAWDHKATAGLNYAYLGGVAYDINGVAFRTNDAAIVLAPGTTNYVERTVDGQVFTNTTGFTIGRLPMAKVQTSANAITSHEDWRGIGSDYAEKQALTTEVTRRVTDHVATVPELTNRLGLKNRKGDRQVVKLPAPILNLAGFIRVGDRLFGIDYVPPGQQGHIVRFNNLDDLTDYTVVNITPISAAPLADGAFNIAYCSGVNKLYVYLSSDKLLQINPDTLGYTVLPQGAPINGNANDQSHDIQADDTYVYIISYSSGPITTRIVRYRAANMALAPTVLDIPNAARAQGSVLADGKLYLQGSWSHSFGSAYAQSWVARVDTATMTLEQLVRLDNQWDDNHQMTAAGNYLFLGTSNPKSGLIYRFDREDLTKYIILQTGIRETLGGTFYDGRFVWAWYTGATVGNQRMVRIDPENGFITRFKVKDASTAETTTPPQPFTSTIISDGERVFIQLANVSSVMGATDPGTNSVAGPYVIRTTLPEATGGHYAGVSGVPVLAMGLKSFGHGRLSTTEAAGIHSVGGSVRIQALSAPSAPGVDPVAPETGGQPADTSYTYYVVAVDAFGHRSLISPAGIVTLAAANLGPTAYQRIAWNPVDGAVSYDVLRGNTSTKIGSTTVPAFLDDGKVGVPYTPPTRSDTADVWVDGAIGIGDLSDPSSFGNFYGLQLESSAASGGVPNIRQASHSPSAFISLWQVNDANSFAIHWKYGSANPGVSAGTLSRANLTEVVTFGGDMLINAFLANDVYVATNNTLRVAIRANGDIEMLTAGAGFIFKSPNGTRYKMTVSDAGAPVFTAI